MARLGKEAVPRQPCPYEDCGCGIDEIWHWGWFFRLDGAIPLSENAFAKDLKLPRFMCTRCWRTFSWRPPFLAFGRRLAALVLQQALKDQAYGRRRRWERNEWYEPNPSIYQELGRTLQAAIPEAEPGQARLSRLVFWHQLRHLAHRMTLSTRQPRMAIHILCVSLARHRDGTRYRLSYC